MKKILIVNQHFETGGIRRSLENLLVALAPKYEIEVVFLSGNLTDFQAKYPNIKCHSSFILSSGLTSSSQLKTMKYYPVRLLIRAIWVVLRKILRGERLIKLAVLLTKPLKKYDCAIAYSHDIWYDNGGFSGGCYEFLRKRVVSSKKYVWFHAEPKAFHLNRDRAIGNYAGFDGVVTVSKACKEQFERITNGQITCQVIRNLYDMEEIENKTIGVQYFAADVFRIVTVGRLSKIAKRIDKVNEIAKLLKQNGYRFDWTVVGGGGEFDECVRICKEYGLDDMVHYIGNQSNPYSYMKQSDILALVSDSEASSMVIHEALIVGTPVVTTNFQAAYESVEDGKNGLICEKDISSIYTKIVDCIEHPEMLKEFRKYIAEHPVNNDASIKALEKMLG